MVRAHLHDRTPQDLFESRRALTKNALHGRFDDHHAELARMLLDQIDALTTQIDTLTARIDQVLAAMPDAQPVDPRPADPTPGQSIDTVSDRPHSAPSTASTRSPASARPRRR